MPANKKFALGPLALTATLTTNIMNPATLTGGTNGGSGNTYILLYHIKVTNKTSGAATFTLYKGATGANTAGTELALARNVPANDEVNLYFPSGILFTTSDFLVGGASAGTTLTISGEGEIGVA